MPTSCAHVNIAMSDTSNSSQQQRCAETRDRIGDLQIFSLTLSQLSYRGHEICAAVLRHCHRGGWIGALARHTCVSYRVCPIAGFSVAGLFVLGLSVMGFSVVRFSVVGFSTSSWDSSCDNPSSAHCYTKSLGIPITSRDMSRAQCNDMHKSTLQHTHTHTQIQSCGDQEGTPGFEPGTC